MRLMCLLNTSDAAVTVSEVRFKAGHFRMKVATHSSMKTVQVARVAELTGEVMATCHALHDNVYGHES